MGGICDKRVNVFALPLPQRLSLVYDNTISSPSRLATNRKRGIIMDIQKIISDVVEKLKGDDKLLAKFKSSPVQTLEKLIGVDLPDEQIDSVIKGITAKLDLDDVADKAKGLMGKLGGLFGK